MHLLINYQGIRDIGPHCHVCLLGLVACIATAMRDGLLKQHFRKVCLARVYSCCHYGL